MAHKEQMDFVRGLKASMPAFFNGVRVLEVGSMNINGTVRDLFTQSEYCGLDLGEGKGVDVVSHVADYQPPHNYDVVISCEALEHDNRWGKSLQAECGMLERGGILVLTWAGPNRPEHGTVESEPASSPATTDHYYAPPLKAVISTLNGFREWTDMCAHVARDGQDCYLWARVA